MGMHGVLFYELDHKKQYYPTRRDEEAVNPDRTALRSGPDCNWGRLNAASPIR